MLFNMKLTLKKNTDILFISKRFSILILVLASMVSCSKKPVREVTIVNPPPVNVNYENGVFVVDEGNYNWGNANITFINASDDSVEQDVFSSHNSRKLGDVAQSMLVFTSKGYILVNNSNKVEVVSLKDFTSLGKIEGFNSPRYMAVIDSNKAYVTNMSQNISVLDLNSLTIVKSIPTFSWTESIIKYNNTVFVSSIGLMNTTTALRNARILVIDAKSDQIIDSIKTGKEPVAMVIDKKNKIWVLCTGGYDHYESPTLVRIDPLLHMVERTFTFSNASDAPSRLCINSTRDTLYFLNNGVCQMPVTSTAIPSQPFIPSNGRLYYGLGISPANGNIFVTDAKDYVQDGVVYQFDQTTGNQLHFFRAGKIPGSFCFTSITGKK